MPSSEARKLASTLPVSVTLAGSSTPTPVYGAAGQPYVPVATFVLAGRSVAPDSLLELSGLLNFALPNAAGRKVQVTIGGSTTLAQSFPTATLGGLQFKQLLWVAPDLQSVDIYATNANDVLAPTTGQGAPFSAHPATKTTLAVDLTADQTVVIQIAPAATETHELSGWSLVNHRFAATPTRSFAPSNAVACWGDSLTAGTGSVSPTGGYVTQLRVAKAGQVVANLGVGGETSAQITTRVLRDKVRGKFWNCVFWMGRNDVGSGTLTATVTGNLASCVANLDPAAKYAVGTIIPAANEAPGGTNHNAILALNSAIRTAYGTKVADVYTDLTSGGKVLIAYRAATATTTGTWTNGSTSVSVASATGIVNGMYVSGTGIPDQTTVTISGTTVTLSQASTAGGTGAALSFVAANEVHLNDAGYTVAKNTVSTVMTTLGM